MNIQWRIAPGVATVVRACLLLISLSCIPRADALLGEEPANPVANSRLHDTQLPPGVIARIGTTRFGNAVNVADYAISTDERILATSTRGTLQIKFWDIASGKELSQFDTSATDLVQLGGFSKNGLLALIEDRARIVVYEEKTRRVHTTIELEAPFGKRDSFSGPWISDAENELTFCVGSRATVYDTTNGKTLREFPCFGVCGYSPRRHLLATANNKEIRLIDVSTGKEMPESPVVREDRLDTAGVALSPDGSLLAFVRRTRQPQVRRGDSPFIGPWEAVVLHTATGNKALRWELGIHHGPECREMSFSLGNQFLVVPGMGDLRIWNIPKSVELPSRTGLLYSRGRCVTRTNQLLCLADDLEFFDLETRLPDKTIPGRKRVTAISPDGRFAATLSIGNTLQMWDATTGAGLWSASCEFDFSCELIFTADSRQLVYLRQRDALRWWDVKNGELLYEFSRSRPLYPLDAELGGIIAYNPNPELLAVQTPTTIVLFDPSSRQKLAELRWAIEQDPGIEIKSMAFSQDGKMLAVGELNTSTDPATAHISLWDIARRRRVGRFESAFVRELAFIPCGRFLIAQGQQAVLIEVATGERASTAPGGLCVRNLGRDWRYRSIFFVEYSPKDRKEQLFRAQVWDVSQARTTLNRQIDLFPAGRYSGSADGTLVAVNEFRNSILIMKSLDYFYTIVPIVTIPRRVDFLACWDGLNGNGSTAYGAMTALVGGHDESVEFLSQKLSPAVAKDSAPVHRSLATLLTNSPEAFDQASLELRRFGPQAIPILKQVLTNDKQLGAYHTIEDIIVQLESPTIFNRADLRGARAVQVLEWIGTPDAIKLLESLASGAPCDQLTTDASAAIRRGRQRVSSK